MKTILLSLILAVNFAAGQSVDTVIKTPILTSYFSNQLHEPLYVVYKLYKGGGKCSRSGLTFKTDGLPFSATASDYSKGGYDEGHLANAEDFAFDCNLEPLTFRFYNCLPQTARLNRGIWKVSETHIREESQTDSLLIICGGIFGKKTIGKGKIAVPDQCWKIVISLHSLKVTHCLLFPNDTSDTYRELDIEELRKLIPFPVIY